jgi:hypothetical protein
MRRSALPRWLPGTRRWISDRPLKSWFDRNKQRSRRRMRKEQGEGFQHATHNTHHSGAHCRCLEPTL